MDTKSTVRDVARGYLETVPSVDLEEFDVVFDDVYSTLDRRFGEEREPGPSGLEEGLPFDAASVADTVITLTCFAAMAFLRAAIKAEVKSLSKQALDRIEETLAAQTGRRKLIHEIRGHLERVLDEL